MPIDRLMAQSSTRALLSDRAKEIEILALRHQLAVLQRQLGPQRVHFAASDRALLAALSPARSRT